jgi:RimJ/RimL family protein N-acetyltransferase
VIGSRTRLVTPRLVLREVGRGSARRLVAGRPRHPAWAEGYPLVGTADAARALLRSRRASGFGLYEIVRGSDAAVIGDIGFHSSPDTDGAVEIGYGVAPGHRRRGVATEAVRALVAWAFDQPLVRVLRARADEDNLASRRVLAAAGFTEAGREPDGRIGHVLRRAA